MAAEIIGLVAACEPALVRQLICKLTPAEEEHIDWNLTGRDLGLQVRDALQKYDSAWVKLQNIESLAKHGTKGTIPSILYNHRTLRSEFEERDQSHESAAVWLALKSDELFECALSALHADQGLNKRSWRAFRTRLSKDAALSFDESRHATFERLVRDAIRRCPHFDSPGELETHHFHRVLFPDDTHSRRAQDQVTVFAEARRVTEEAFIDQRVQTRLRRRVDSISLVFDRQRRELDVVSIGGRIFLEEVGRAFFSSYCTEQPPLEPLIRRKVNFHLLSRKRELILADQHHFERTVVDEIRVRSPSGLLLTLDAKSMRSRRLDVYDIAQRDFKERSPFNNEGWTVVSARLLFIGPQKTDGRKARLRAVDLKSNGHTNLREQDDIDRHIADDCLTKWGILEPGGDESDDA
jgi:hypothetical protein